MFGMLIEDHVIKSRQRNISSITILVKCLANYYFGEMYCYLMNDYGEFFALYSELQD